tara:strand:+ start:101 stop:325 length:225 start_codon:yes stop_codon:yes gene_type:complete
MMGMDYTEKELDHAYRLDCRLRTQQDLPWIYREEFRVLFEDVLQSIFEAEPDIGMEHALAAIELLLSPIPFPAK